MATATFTDHTLAILGGTKAVTVDEPGLFKWPLVTQEDEQAILSVLRDGSMSGWDITKLFEAEWSAYLGVKFSLGHPNGTSALLSCMYGCGVRRGDEVIAPSMTYWASILQSSCLGATPIFADCDPVTLCIDPRDIEHRITKRTKAIVAVHYCGHPADMDPIMAIARKHGIKVIEDVSHAHGARYKGRMVGSIGDCAGFSMMSGKSFAIGEAGMLSTNDRAIFENAVAFGCYERMTQELTIPELRAGAGLPFGALKNRMNQWSAAMGRVQLKHYEARIHEIQNAMNRFWDLLAGCPGIRPHRPIHNTGCTMGGWYNPLGFYVQEELGGLPKQKFIEAVVAEGGRCGRGSNMPLHLHPVLNTIDVYGDGKPTRLAFTDRDVRQGTGSLPVTESLGNRVFGVPWFKHDKPDLIERYASAFRKVAMQSEKLLPRA